MHAAGATEAACLPCDLVNCIARVVTLWFRSATGFCRAFELHLHSADRCTIPYDRRLDGDDMKVLLLLVC